MAKLTNIWVWDNYRGWQIRHREVVKTSAAYWLARHRDAMISAGIERPLLKAQIREPKPLIISAN